MVIVMEHLKGGELFEKIVADEELLEADCCFYMRQVCQVCWRGCGIFGTNFANSNFRVWNICTA